MTPDPLVATGGGPPRFKDIFSLWRARAAPERCCFRPEPEMLPAEPPKLERLKLCPFSVSCSRRGGSGGFPAGAFSLRSSKVRLEDGRSVPVGRWTVGVTVCVCVYESREKSQRVTRANGDKQLNQGGQPAMQWRRQTKHRPTATPPSKTAKPNQPTQLATHLSADSLYKCSWVGSYIRLIPRQPPSSQFALFFFSFWVQSPHDVTAKLNTSLPHVTAVRKIVEIHRVEGERVFLNKLFFNAFKIKRSLGSVETNEETGNLCNKYVLKGTKNEHKTKHLLNCPLNRKRDLTNVFYLF